MLAKYGRAARTVAELGLGDMLPLDEAIPELRHQANRGRERTQKITSTSGGMADAPDLGSGAARRESSSLSSCTNELENKLEYELAEMREESDEVALFSTAGCTFPGKPANPRSSAVRELSARLAELVASGDLEGARAVSDAITRLLGTGERGAVVVDIGAVRGKRDK
jgi:hypothetical protein